MAKSKKGKHPRFKGLPKSKIKKLKQSAHASASASPKHIAKRAAPPKQQKHSKKPATAAKTTVPYAPSDRILLLGEANFSFAVSLVTIFQRSVGSRHQEEGRPQHEGAHASDEEADSDDDELSGIADEAAAAAPAPAAAPNLVATTYDSREVTFQKYPDAEANVALLEQAQVRVLFGVDATRLGAHRAAFSRAGVTAFDKIVFNFPHVGLGIKDRDRNVLANQQLLHGFFVSVSESRMIGPASEVHVTLKTGLPYELWAVKEMARGRLASKTSFAFHPGLYPGYAHRRTLGYREGLSAAANEELAGKECRTYVFQLPQQKQQGGKRKKQRCDLSDDDDDDE